MFFSSSEKYLYYIDKECTFKINKSCTVFMLQASYFLLEYRPRRSVVLQAHMKLYKPKDLGSFYLWNLFHFIQYKQKFTSTRVHLGLSDGVHVAHLFSFLCCPITYLNVLSSVLWCPLPFPHTNDVRFVFIPSCM